MSKKSFQILKDKIKQNQKVWLVTGVAGFIGSNLLETLLKLDQIVIGLDNLSTGSQDNLNEVQGLVSQVQWDNFSFIQGDICDLNVCSTACAGVDYVLHQAALGSVPRSILDPVSTNHANVVGFLNILTAAKDAKIKRFVYAASSSTYGDHPDLPKIEAKIGKPLSPYAVSKLVNEIYAEVFALNYGYKTIGLRYFNVFGRRQDPNGAYAAVIPKWISSLIKDEAVYINGDGETSRDFCYIDNVVQANLRAVCVENEMALNNVYNVALGGRTSLNQLYLALSNILAERLNRPLPKTPNYREFRDGDVRHSLADISKAMNFLDYSPTHDVWDGLNEVVDWYIGSMA